MKPIPAHITVNTGEQHKITKTIDDFFIETNNFIKQNYKIQDEHIEIKSGQRAIPPSQISNDRITYLSYKNTPVAIVLETRTEFNHVEYTFFRNLDILKEII